MYNVYNYDCASQCSCFSFPLPSLLPPSSLSSKLEHLTALQRHLEDSLNKERPSDTAANISEGDTHYTNYYFMGGEEEETTSDTEHPVSSTPKKTSPRRRLSSDLAATTAALRDATAQVGGWGISLVFEVQRQSANMILSKIWLYIIIRYCSQ